jgi:hypothetical protein
MYMIYIHNDIFKNMPNNGTLIIAKKCCSLIFLNFILQLFIL